MKPELKHDHLFTKTVAYSRGLVTLQCGCGKLALHKVSKRSEYETMRDVLKLENNRIRQFFKQLNGFIETLKSKGLNRGEIGQVLKGVKTTI